jgi:hypothetical protein
LLGDPFSRLLAGQCYWLSYSCGQGGYYALAFYPETGRGTTEQHNAAQRAVEALTQAAQGLLRELPRQARDRLVLPPAENWWRTVFHLAWHFPQPFLKAYRQRLLTEDGAHCARVEETFMQLHGYGGRKDILPGLMYSNLDHDLCISSEAAIDAVLDILRRDADAPDGGPQGASLTQEQREAFRRLRADFEAGMTAHRELECKLMKLADSFETPPAAVWAELRVGGCHEQFPTLSRLNDMQEIVQIRGPATRWFCEVAERAGNALPAWVPDNPILFDNIRRNGAGLPVGLSVPRPTMNRSPLARWVGFVFAILKQREHEALQVRWGTHEGPLSYALATLDRDLFAASVLAIDLAELAAVSTDAPPQAGGTMAGSTSRTAALRETAAGEYAASTGSFWLAAIPAGLRINCCAQEAESCGVVAEGGVALPSGSVRFLGTVALAGCGDLCLLAFSLLHRRTDELDRFLTFAAEAGVAFVAEPPAWARSACSPGGAAATWAAVLMFLSPSAPQYVLERPGGCRLIRQPWAASLAALGDHHTAAHESVPAGRRQDEAMADLSAAQGAQQEGHNHQRPNGVEGGCWLWWEGKRHDIPKGVVYRLIAFMLGRDSAPYDDLEGDVFEDAVLPGTVRARTSEVNRVLKKIGVSWRLQADATGRILTKQPMN